MKASLLDPRPATLFPGAPLSPPPPACLFLCCAPFLEHSPLLPSLYLLPVCYSSPPPDHSRLPPALLGPPALCRPACVCPASSRGNQGLHSATPEREYRRRSEILEEVELRGGWAWTLCPKIRQKAPRCESQLGLLMSHTLGLSFLTCKIKEMG